MRITISSRDSREVLKTLFGLKVHFIIEVRKVTEN